MSGLLEMHIKKIPTAVIGDYLYTPLNDDDMAAFAHFSGGLIAVTKQHLENMVVSIAIMHGFEIKVIEIINGGRA